MSVDKKLEMFELLCRIGFKEIEVGFPSASDTEYTFIRRLIEEGRVPVDVTLQVLTPSRETLIRRTLQSLEGLPSAIVHVYNATSPTFREVVFGFEPADVIQLAVEGVTLVKQLSRDLPGTRVQLEYSAECFSATELEVAKDVFDAVVLAWGATPDNKVILNLPATVEVATPNVYADQVEWMHRHLARRESVVLSVHPHNDRGTAVAAAELAMMAGAERVEGCLFGNGERTGNVDLVTLALNLHTQGVDCGLDFSNLDEIARVNESCTQLPIHPRHPYVGDLVYTAFSGSHQDAIKKGMAARHARPLWDVPYLPLDPTDVGRTYESLIRVNSQSGKGGVAYLLEAVHGLVMPRRLQVEFSSVIQRHADATGGEVSVETLWALFEQEYLVSRPPLEYLEHHLYESPTGQGVRLSLRSGQSILTSSGEGNGPIAAAVQALRKLGYAAKVLSYEERSLQGGADARACAFVEVMLEDGPGARFGVGVHPNIITASLQALVSALNRLYP